MLPMQSRSNGVLADYPPDSAGVSKALQDTLAAVAGSALRDDGDVDKAFADAPRDRLVEAEYSVPFLAHTCMEPMNATARLKDGVLDIWAPTQFPTVSRLICAELAGVEQDKTNVHTTFLGGGFGHYVRAVRGEPVRHAFRLRAGVDVGDDRVLLLRVEVERLPHVAVEVGHAVRGLHA